jgi:hypothetical protein
MSEVRYELQIALTPMFMPAFDTKEERPKRTIRREHANGWIEFLCWEWLSTFDESVALSVLSLMIKKNDKAALLSKDPKTEIGKILREIFDPKNQVGHDIGVLLETSVHEIAQEFGYKRPSSDNYEKIRDSLTRLSRVWVSERNEKEKYEIHGESGFIRHKVKDDGTLAIVVMRRLSMAVFGEDGWLYAVINLDERNALKGDIAKSTHKFLTAWVWTGCREITFEKLATHVWFDWKEKSPSNKSNMRRRLLDALFSIGELPEWDINLTGKGRSMMVHVKRRGKESKSPEREHI